MKPPKRVKIGPHQYRIEFDHKSLMDPERSGQGRIEDLTLGVQLGMAYSQEQDTVLHEVLHMMLVPLGKEHDEGLVQFLSPALLQLLQDNPKLVEYLTS